MSLGKVIRSSREVLGMSQAKLSSEAGLSQGYLSQLEKDEVANPSAIKLLRLAKTLNLHPNKLFREAGYQLMTEDEETEYTFALDPELLEFLSKFSTETQENLLDFLVGLEGARS